MQKRAYFLLDILRHYMCSLKLFFLGSLVLNFEGLCEHILSKFTNKESTFPSKANLAKCLLIGLLLSSCQRDFLSVRREFLSRQSYASHYVETPDPNLYCPPIGESLVVSWNLPCSDLNLRATLRFMNGEEQVVYRKLYGKRGTTALNLINDEYFRVGGFRTYKLNITDEQGEEVTSFYHHLFTEIIQFSTP